MAYTRKHIHKKIISIAYNTIIKIIKHSTIRNKIPNNNIIFCIKFPSSNGSFKDKKHSCSVPLKQFIHNLFKKLNLHLSTT